MIYRVIAGCVRRPYGRSTDLVASSESISQQSRSVSTRTTFEIGTEEVHCVDSIAI
jgi:hypothetical protein